MGIASTTTYRCGCEEHADLPLTNEPKSKSYDKAKRPTSLDYDDNINAVLMGYINGTGARDVSKSLTLLDLPKASNFQRTCTRHQGIIGDKIREVTAREMDLALLMEIEATILHEKGEEYYEAWKKYR